MVEPSACSRSSGVGTFWPLPSTRNTFIQVLSKTDSFVFLSRSQLDSELQARPTTASRSTTSVNDRPPDLISDGRLLVSASGLPYGKCGKRRVPR